MMPLRERIMRKAKDKAVENLHELTSSYQRNGSNSLNDGSILSSPLSAINKSKRGNRTSYKSFAEPGNLSDEEQSDCGLETETPSKKAPRARRKLTNSAAKEKASAKSKQNATYRQQQNADTIDTLSSDNSLFSQILAGQAATQAIVDDWIESYKKNKERAMLDLIQFIVRSTGCKAAYLINNKEILKTKEFTDTINELIENFNDEDNTAANPQTNNLPSSSGDAYPFVQTSVQAKRFKLNFCEFLNLLIKSCQYSIIYDQFMTDILITFLIALADSQVRAFRHTATLAVLKIMTRDRKSVV